MRAELVVQVELQLEPHHLHQMLQQLEEVFPPVPIQFLYEYYLESNLM